MPVMNGIEATNAIRLMDRSDARMIPIKNAGMNAHLSKPLDGKAVIRVISGYSRR